ncbi:MAG: universal stress protein [Bacteroidales bacterium]|nr:universal stress protein [Bacteroidales bacterium]MBN2699055.1 universal stress protein [Bacteroidales bacterium]
MKNFIVPIDFSNDSLAGLDMAVMFSKKKEINIQMVYVLTRSTYYQPGTVEEEYRFAEKNFKKMIQEVEPKLGNNSRIRYIIKKGKVYREVVNQVNSYSNAVVSASTHGASGFEELFGGSNALKIMASTSQPVITIKQGPVPENITKIVLPVKLHVDTRQKVPMAASLAQLFGAEIHVITISTSEGKRDLDRLRTYSRQVEGYLKSKNIPFTTKTLLGDSLPSLTINYAEAIEAELIVIMSSQIDKWNVFLGSFAQQMLNRSMVPLLSIKPKEKHIPTGFSTFGE